MLGLVVQVVSWGQVSLWFDAVVSLYHLVGRNLQCIQIDYCTPAPASSSLVPESSS